MKRGQVTAYMILGVLIVMIFLSVLYLMSTITSSKLSSEQRKVIAGVLEASAVNYYAQICLEDALEEGLKLMGRQGGVIYLEQGGIIDKDRIGYWPDETDEVGLNIKMADFYPGVPAYPCKFNLSGPRYCRYPAGDYSFGQNILLTETAMKNQLAFFILNRTEKCVNELMVGSTLAQQFGFNVKTSIQSAKATILMGGSATSVKLDYPLEVEIGGKDPVTNFLHWSARSEVRLKLIRDLIDEILDKDISRIDFDLIEDIQEQNSDNLFFPHIGEIKTKVRRGLVDVFIFNDSISKINGENFVFKIARKNRPPALEWIQKNYSLDDDYDYLVIQGEPINISMKAGDPDEDEIDHYFSGDLISGDYESINFEYSTVDTQPDYYNITAKVTDGLSDDWQLIRVLIDNKLETNFTVESYYGFPVLTLEDPIVLNASLTTKSLDLGARLEYKWIVPFYNLTEKECLVMPGLKDCTVGLQYDPRTIKDEMDSLTNGLLFQSPFELEAKIYYNGRNQSDLLTLNPTVKQCYRYVNDQHPYPYPYHEITRDGGNTPGFPQFLATHACCGPDDMFLDEEAVCFRKNITSCENHREYTNVTKRHCSGLRGNICGGEWEWEMVETGEC